MCFRWPPQNDLEPTGDGVQGRLVGRRLVGGEAPVVALAAPVHIIQDLKQGLGQRDAHRWGTGLTFLPHVDKVAAATAFRPTNAPRVQVRCTVLHSSKVEAEGLGVAWRRTMMMASDSPTYSWLALSAPFQRSLLLMSQIRMVWLISSSR